MEEITTAISLDQGVWKTAVSGGLCEVNRKYKDAIMRQWGANFVCCGNEGMGSYNNAQGSTTRRCLVFQFKNKPREVDRTLKTQVSQSFFYTLYL